MLVLALEYFNVVQMSDCFMLPPEALRSRRISSLLSVIFCHSLGWDIGVEVCFRFRLWLRIRKPIAVAPTPAEPIMAIVVPGVFP